MHPAVKTIDFAVNHACCQKVGGVISLPFILEANILYHALLLHFNCNKDFTYTFLKIIRFLSILDQFKCSIETFFKQTDTHK